MSGPFNITTMKESVMGTEGKQWEASSKSTHIFFLLLLHDWRVARMRNWVVSEVKGLKNLPMTNVLFDPFERVQASMASSGFFTQTTRQRQQGPWVLWTFQNTDWKKKAEVWGHTKNTIFRHYGTWRQWNSILGEGILHKMPQWLSAICNWPRNSFVLWRIWLFLFSLLLLCMVVPLKITFIESTCICQKEWVIFERVWV